MKLPTTIKVTYIANSDMPVMTSESLHVISELEDLNILLSYIEVFHSLDWNLQKLEYHIVEAQKCQVSNIKSEVDFLSFGVI